MNDLDLRTHSPVPSDSDGYDQGSDGESVVSHDSFGSEGSESSHSSGDSQSSGEKDSLQDPLPEAEVPEDADVPKQNALEDNTPNALEENTLNDPGGGSYMYKLKTQIFSAENKALYDLAFELYKKNNKQNETAKHIQEFNTFLQQNQHFNNITSLLPHQEEGVNFALHNIIQKDLDGCLLAHTMGAGKSIQAMAIMYILQEHYNFSRCLLICPKSMFGTWAREIGNLRYSYKKYSHGDTQATFEEQNESKPNKNLISLYTNESFKSFWSTTQSLAEQFFDLIIVDEAHSLKNDQGALYGILNTIKNKVYAGDNDAKSNKAQKEEPARTNFLLLTGTPIHNSILELMSLCSMLVPTAGKNKGKWTAFRELTDTKPSSASLSEFLSRIEKMRSAWKDDPDKSMLAEVEQLDKNLSNFIKITVSPFLHRIGEEFINDKLKVRDGDKERNLTLTRYNVMFNIDDIEAVKKVKDSQQAYLQMSELSWGLMNGESPPKETFKTEFLRRFIAQLESVPLQNRRKVIFFHVHTAIAKRVQTIIKNEVDTTNCDSVQCVDGSSNFKHREECFQNFNDSNHELRYLILQEQVGGVGVNLQKTGTVVVYLEINFNPALTKQSTARIWRLGQTRDCYAINLITQFSTEMVTYNVNARKNHISLEILDSKKVDEDARIQKTNLKKFRDDWNVAEKISQQNMELFLNTHLRHPELNIESEDFRNALSQIEDHEPEVHADSHNLSELFQVKHTDGARRDFVIMKPPQERIDTVKTEKEDMSSIKHNLDQKIAYVLYVGANNIYKTADAVRGIIDCNGKVWSDMVEEVRSKLLTRVYFCERTGYFIYKNGFTDKPPLFWPGVPILGDEALDVRKALVQKVDQAYMRSNQYTRQQGQRFPKIDLLIDREQFQQKHHDTANPQKIQSMIDNFHYCLHYPMSMHSPTESRDPTTWKEFMSIVKDLQNVLVISGLPELEPMIIGPGNLDPSNTDPGDLAAGQPGPSNLAADVAVPGQPGPSNLAADVAAPGQPGPGDLAADVAAPGQPGPDGLPAGVSAPTTMEYFELFSVTDSVAANFFKEFATGDQDHIKLSVFSTGDTLKKTPKSTKHSGPDAISFEAVKTADSLKFSRISLEMTFLGQENWMHTIKLSESGLCKFTFESDVLLSDFLGWCQILTNVDGLSMLSMTLKRTAAENGVSVFAVIKDGEAWWRFDRGLPEVMHADECKDDIVLEATFHYSAMSATDICFDRQGNFIPKTNASREIEIRVNPKLRLMQSNIKTWLDNSKTSRVREYIKRIISDGYGVPFEDINPEVERLEDERGCYKCNDVVVKLYLKFDDGQQDLSFEVSMIETTTVSALLQKQKLRERKIQLINGNTPPGKGITTRNSPLALLQLTRGKPSDKFELTLTQKPVKEKPPKAENKPVEIEDGL
tara:strand:- start:4758 stop:8996 length:4239 start_codon:yes stop_codon:yes gene_type:complete